MDPLVVRRYPGIENFDPAAIRALAKESKARGWNLNDLLGQIWIESGFDPSAQNPYSSAAGLIQMTDSSSRANAGVSSKQLAKMSSLQQVPGIVSFYSSAGRGLKNDDFRQWGYSPNIHNLHNASPARIVYPAGSTAAKVNPYVTDAQGNITVGTIREQWYSLVGRDWPGYTVPEVSLASSAGILIIPALFFAWQAFKGRNRHE